jgi:AraC family transcriptional regulator, transcriptional activator FtrA
VSRRHVVATAVVDGANAFELAVATEVFGLPRPELAGAWHYEHRLCTPAGGVALTGGMRLEGSHDLSGLDDADTILIAHGRVSGEADPRIVDAVRAADERGARLVSFCSGSFTLAAAGVLDGRRATTHWMYADAFRSRFPRVRLDPNVLFVDEGRILTSAGTAAGIDLALHLVREDLGAEAARSVARRMVVPPHREGGQAQFIDPPHVPRVESDRFGALLDWLAGRLDEDVTVAEMAHRVAMSERTFARRFKEATGTTPFRWVLAQRLRLAQELLETSDLDIDRLADRAGFGTATNLREHFRRELGTTPTAYRRCFRGSPARVA